MEKTDNEQTLIYKIIRWCHFKSEAALRDSEWQGLDGVLFCIGKLLCGGAQCQSRNPDEAVGPALWRYENAWGKEPTCRGLWDSRNRKKAKRVTKTERTRRRGQKERPGRSQRTRWGIWGAVCIQWGFRPGRTLLIFNLILYFEITLDLQKSCIE